MISDALDVNLISAIVGYKLAKGDFSTSSPNLPQTVCVFSEANTANQSNLDLTPTQFTNAVDAANKYGYGSPIHQIMRILFPFSGGGCKVPVFVYPQAEPGGAASKKLKIVTTGTATGNGTVYLVVNGRNAIDGVAYAVNIAIGDTPTIISGKFADAANAILGCPAIGTVVVADAVFESKWAGLTAEAMNISIDTNGSTTGCTFAITSIQTALGTPSVAAQLANFGSKWNTIVINGYGTHAATMTAFEGFNGIPDPINPTGRYAADKMLPFICLTGSVADNDSATTDAKLNDVTIAICPAPLSKGMQFEAAANMAILYANNSSNTPELHILNQAYPDMPIPADGNIGTMMVYANRDVYVKKGNTTVDIQSNKYVVKDFVTTYHKAGENPPQFRYCRDLMVDFNARYSYLLLEQRYVVGKVIASDSDPVTNNINVIRPKQWKAILAEKYFKDMVDRALFTDAPFSLASLQVGIGTTNPNRIETAFPYKRTGGAIVLSTTASGGFSFGTVN